MNNNKPAFTASRTHAQIRRLLSFSACSTGICLMIATAAMAQEQGDHDLSPDTIPALTTSTSISGRDSAITSRRIDTAQLRALSPTTSDTAKALQSIARIGGDGAGGFSTLPSIRGLGARRLNILVDGVNIAMACPNDMNPPLSYTDPQTLDSVRLITGISPVHMGGDSIGGVISVKSSTPVFSDDGSFLITGDASSFYRSNGDGFGGAINLTAATGRFSFNYAGSFTQSDAVKAGGDLGRIASTEYKKTDHAATIAARTDLGVIELKGGYHFSPYESFPNQHMDMTSNTSWFLNGHYEGMFDWGNIDLRAYYRDTDHVMNFLSDKGGSANGGMPMHTKVQQAGTSLKTEIMMEQAGILRLGYEFNHEATDDYWPPVAGSMMMGPNPYININGGQRDRIGTYIEWEKSWSSGLNIIAGVRNDQVWMNSGMVAPYGTGMMQMADMMAADAFNAANRKRHDSNWGGSLIIRYPVSDGLDMELGYARKVRSPNIYERYSWGRGSMSSSMIGWYGDGNGYVGNIALNPEKADTVSGALRLHDARGDKWSISISPYYTRVHDYIDAVKLRDISADFVQLQFTNQRAELYGVDVDAEAVLLSGHRLGSISMTATANWQRGNNLDDGGSLYHQMPLNMALGIKHVTGGLTSQISISHVTRKDRVDATRNEPETRAYTLANLQFGYEWDRFRVNAGVDNLFDKAYFTPLGGMSIGDYNVNGVLRPVPGTGRSFNFGIGVKF